MRRIEEWRIYGIVEREEFMLEYLMCLRIWIYFGNLIIIEVRRMNVRKFKNSEVIKVLFSIRMLVFWEISHNSKHYWFEKLKNFTMQFDFSFWKSKNKPDKKIFRMLKLEWKISDNLEGFRNLFRSLKSYCCTSSITI